MRLKKVITIIGTRPELIKMSETIRELDKYTNHILVHTGQNYDYGLNEVFFQDLGIRRPDYFLEVAEDSLSKTIGNIIVKCDEIFEKEIPDALVVYGDTNSCLCVIPAKRRKIPIFHFEAGNRCFDLRVPEETNRKIVDHLSDINFPITEHARRYLISEGIKPETIIKLGSPMFEILHKYEKNINDSNILNTMSLENYILVSFHREENIDNEENFINIIESLNALANRYNMPIIVSTHPRTMKKIKTMNCTVNNHIKFCSPFGFFDYCKLQKNAFCVISDSGTLTEESSILHFPAINMRNSHERPEGNDHGVLIMSGTQPDNILMSVQMITLQHQSLASSNIPFDYINHSFSISAVRNIVSYIDYVNKNTWKK